MKHILLILLFCLTSAFSFAQTKQSNEYYEKGNRYLASKDYTKAIEYFSFSIKQLPTANAYFNRALSYYEMSDSCNYCKDLYMAASFGDSESVELYNKKCINTRIHNKVPDSLILNHPNIIRLETIYQKCSSDSIIYVIEKIKGAEHYTKISEINKGPVFEFVEEMPVYAGGEAAKIRFLANNIHYSKIAKQENIQGTVYVSFIVETDGTLSDIALFRGIEKGCDEESVRVVKMMPKWIPGKQHGKAVRVQFKMPIKFTLN